MTKLNGYEIYKYLHLSHTYRFPFEVGMFQFLIHLDD